MAEQQYSDLPAGASVVHDPTQESQYSDLPPGAKVVNGLEAHGAASRLGTSFRQATGVPENPVSDLTGGIKFAAQHPVEAAKQLVTSPWEGYKSAATEQHQRMMDAYKRGDYGQAAVHGLYYILSPLGGANLGKAGEQFKSGDIAGGVGTTAGAVAPYVVGTPEARANLAVPARAVRRGIGKAATVASDIVDPDVLGLVSPRLAHAARLAGKTGRVAEKLSSPEGITPIAPLTRGGMAAGRNFLNTPGIEGEEPVAPGVPSRTTNWPPAAPRNVIQRAAEKTSKAELADRLETKDIQAQMRRDLEEHGHSAYSQEKRDWFARNQPGSTKGELTAQTPPVTSVPPVRARVLNASGESPASAEAISRVASEKAGGIKRFRIDTRSGKEVPLIGVDAVDAKAGPYDRIVQRGPKGEVTLDEGLKARPVRTMKSGEDLIEGLKSMKAKK